MKLVYSRRALADLDNIAAYYRERASPAVAGSIGLQLTRTIERIVQTPAAAPRISQRSRIRVAAVVRYPYKIFYRTRDDTVDILHIRHTSRRPFEAD
ncbi:plasmid stabilization system protein ParE [Rhodopseudomonas rhenobacensis]|uniref:Plasmid stabilization system protein ParE n=1 Tax=Rhodopseudomonas rhenobacensis TaxID=87461 RepID=A0A7W7Z3R4_9BRAD|nr:type II toxin-antitoxin system RelE/ParE family toxin [Rhodopseudomonas rhenobacensis]MBB5047485.1 plasmid stabilization system protein ParE [Rhodopseudomonas rhenobacensis]